MRTANSYPNRIVKSIKSRCLSLLVCMLLIFLTPQISSAYDNDTHFWLTYYLAVKVGYTNTQATQIASANIAVDFDKDTEPLLPSFDHWKDWFHPLSHFQNIRAQFHALPLTASIFDKEWWNPTKLEINDENLKKAQVIVDTRKKQFWKETLREGENPGLFLHYLQDIFAHNGFTSYVGHAGYYYVDFLDSDAEKAERMAFETLKYLIVFRQALLNEKPSENLLDPESLRIEDLISPEVILDIKKTVEEFRKINPSKGVVPNRLVQHWNSLTDEEKRKYKLPAKPYEYGRSLAEIKKNGPAPDSSKARRLVQELLSLKESEMPQIWLYDFNSNGKVQKESRASRALVYVANKSRQDLFTGRDEEKNTERREIKVNSKKQCLPFSLKSKNSLTDTLNCE
jgi:uncharacterized protein DUF6765